MDLTTNQLGVIALIWAALQWWIQRRDARSKLAVSESEAVKAVKALEETVGKQKDEIAAERLRGDRLQARVNHLESLCFPTGARP